MTYGLTDLRVFASRGGRVIEIALQDIGDVEHSAIAARPAARHVDPHRARRATPAHPGVVPPRPARRAARRAARAARRGSAGFARRGRRAGGARLGARGRPACARDGRCRGCRCRRRVRGDGRAPVVVAGAVAYPPDDAISPGGLKRSDREIVAFMESVVMPWARVALGRIKGGAENVTCETCHGDDARERAWQMPAVAALPEPHFDSSDGSSMARPWTRRCAMRSTDIWPNRTTRRARPTCARSSCPAWPGCSIARPTISRSYEYNRTRAAFGCYHCHRVQ